MRNVVLCIFLLCLSVALASWSKVERAACDEPLAIRFALKQHNLDILQNTLLDVANPYSENYGKWWAPSAILDLVSPPESVSGAVAGFLLKSGAYDVENHRDMVKCTMSVCDIEFLLQTTLYYFEHSNGRSMVIRTRDGYVLPSAIAQYVSFVAGIAEFPEPRKLKIADSQERGVAEGYVTVAHIQELYQLPTIYTQNANSSLGLIEFEDDKPFFESDLALFVTMMGIPNITVEHIVGPYNTTSPDAESSLDVQYGGGIAISSSVWFWTEVGWMYEFATDLLTAAQAPLVVSMSWGWPEPEQCQLDPNQCGTGTSFMYVDRVNVEFQKVGLRGITLVAASGDQGAPGDGNYDCSNTTSPLSTIFPGASPWVLSVGATMLEGALDEESSPTADPPVCSKVKCATSLKEEVCTYPGALITTGGGFSNLSPRPSFQDTTVSAYLSSGVKLPTATFFNSSNRGFPDVSALGHNYLIEYFGEITPVDGTSCSSPVLAAIFTLLNSYRLNNKKSPLGYVVPLVYAAYAADPTTFTDITSGDNKCTEECCSKFGYEATTGWDPVTGLGTPQYPKLLKYVQGLK